MSIDTKQESHDTPPAQRRGILSPVAFLGDPYVPILNINGRDVSVDGPKDMLLLCVLRDRLGLTGTKFGFEPR